MKGVNGKIKRKEPKVQSSGKMKLSTQHNTEEEEPMTQLNIALNQEEIQALLLPAWGAFNSLINFNTLEISALTRYILWLRHHSP